MTLQWEPQQEHMKHQSCDMDVSVSMHSKVECNESEGRNYGDEGPWGYSPENNGIEWGDKRTLIMRNMRLLT